MVTHTRLTKPPARRAGRCPAPVRPEGRAAGHRDLPRWDVSGRPDRVTDDSAPGGAPPGTAPDTHQAAGGSRARPRRATNHRAGLDALAWSAGLVGVPLLIVLLFQFSQRDREPTAPSSRAAVGALATRTTIGSGGAAAIGPTCAPTAYTGTVTSSGAAVRNEATAYRNEDCAVWFAVSWVGQSPTEPDADNPRGQVCHALTGSGGGPTDESGNVTLQFGAHAGSFTPHLGASGHGPATCREAVDRDLVGTYMPAWATASATAVVTDTSIVVPELTLTNEWDEVFHLSVSLSATP